MMKPEFAALVHKLMVHYGKPDPGPERMDSTFELVKHLPGDAKLLEAISVHIRSTADECPRNLSKAILNAHEIVNRGVPDGMGEQGQRYVPLTPEQAAIGVQRCRDIRNMLATGARPPWAGEPRGAAGYSGPDSYHRGGEAK